MQAFVVMPSAQILQFLVESFRDELCGLHPLVEFKGFTVNLLAVIL